MDASADKIRCDACPVLCYIRDGMRGACDRYANEAGRLVRVDTHVLLNKRVEQGGDVVPFQGGAWDGNPLVPGETFVITNLPPSSSPPK
jgi:6-hydroxynicotinate reductase